MKLSTFSAAVVVPLTVASAQHLTVENFVLYGAQDSTGVTPNYTQGFTVGSVPIHITNPLVVVSIENTAPPQHYECTFTGAEGTNTTVGESGTAVVDPPQAQVELYCSSVYIS